MYKPAVLTAQILISWQIGGSALAESTDSGRLLYADHCTACHGVDLEGARLAAIWPGRAVSCATA